MGRPRKFKHNVLISLSGSILPAAVGVFGTALLLGAPQESSVVLLAAWSVLGYMTLTDLGLTRSASKMVSSGQADPATAIAELWRPAIPLGVAIGLVVAVLAVVVNPWLWLLLPIPLVSAMQFPLMGALEAQGRFDVLATQRLLNACLTYLLPAACAVIFPTTVGLAVGLSLLSVGRVALFFVLRRQLRLPLFTTFRATFRARPVKHGKGLVFWVGLSSILGPAFLYADRLALAAAGVPTEVWVFYVALSEILMKSYVLPSAVLSVAFPWLAANARGHLKALRRAATLWFPLGMLVGAVAAIAAGFLLPNAVFASIAPSAEQGDARLVAILLTAGTIVNWASQGYIALLQALDRQRFVAIAQICLVPAFVVGLFMASAAGSVVAIAAVALGRIALFSAILAVAAWFVTSPRLASISSQGSSRGATVAQ